MSWRKVSACCLMTMLFCATADGRVRRQGPASPAVDIRQVDFKNFTFRTGWDEGAAARRLRDGRHEAADGAGTGLMRTAYGDLTGDGAEEAVVLLRGQNTRISRTLDEVFIYTLKDGEPIAVDHFEAGRRGDYVLSVESLKSNFQVEGRLLTLDLAVWRTGEHFPTHYYTAKYRWNGVQMAEVERSCLKPLPEGMREIGRGRSLTPAPADLFSPSPQPLFVQLAPTRKHLSP